LNLPRRKFSPFLDTPVLKTDSFTVAWALGLNLPKYSSIAQKAWPSKYLFQETSK